jgi:hypothetical protein
MVIDCNKIYTESNSAQSDYTWKGDLKNEGTQRLSMWETAHMGETYTSGIVEIYKSLTDDAVKREKNFRASGEVYRSILNSYPDCYTSDSIQLIISIINQNVDTSTNDQNIEIAHYQLVERDYILQQQEQKRIALATADLEKTIQQGNNLRLAYDNKRKLRNEGIARLDSLYQSHIGTIIINENDIRNLKNVLDDTLQREVDFRNSANTYKDFLNKHISAYDPSSLVLIISDIDENIDISTSGQNTEITQYQDTEKRYLEQENIAIELAGGGLLIAGLGIIAFLLLRNRKIEKKKTSS